jgi:hypothetical protein
MRFKMSRHGGEERTREYIVKELGLERQAGVAVDLGDEEVGLGLCHTFRGLE